MVDPSEDRANIAQSTRPMPVRPNQGKIGPMGLDMALDMFLKDDPILKDQKPSGEIPISNRGEAEEEHGQQPTGLLDLDVVF